MDNADDHHLRHQQDSVDMGTPVCVVRSKNAEVFLNGFDDLSRLTDGNVIELRNYDLDQFGLQQLDKLYNCCQNKLHTLHLENCTLSDRFLSFSINRLDKSDIRLTQFVMKNCHPLTMNTLISISTLFTSTLVILELSSCKLARQAGIILSQSLQSCKALRRLCLADNNLRDGGLRVLVDALKALFLSVLPSDRQGMMLEELDISQNGISSTGFTLLMHLPVKHLNVADNTIETVGNFLFTNTTLHTLDLSGNSLSDTGWHELVSTLFHDQVTVKILKLQGCGLSESSANFLQQGFLDSTHCSLHELYLGEDEDGAIQERIQELKRVIEAVYSHLKIVLGSFNGQEEQYLSPQTAELPIDTAPLVAAELKAVALATKESLQADLSSTFISRQETDSEQKRPSSASLPASRIRRGFLSSPIHQHPSSSSSKCTSIQHVDVEFIVSKTIECMNQNFEQRLGRFLTRMENQQFEKISSQVQFLAAKVEACERAIPRMEARMDVLTDRIASGNAQLTKIQNDFQMQLQQTRQDLFNKATQATASASSGGSPSSRTPLTRTMESQVEELITTKVRVSETAMQGELQRIRRDTNPHAVVEAVSMHLTQFKQDFDSNQNHVLRQFTENIVKDGLRLEDRMNKMEYQIKNLENVIQAEQQASLQALEAISDALEAAQ